MTDDPAMWSRAKMVAEYIVSDWMLLEADERTMSALVKEIEVELDKAFDDGMKAVVGFSQSLIRADALEEAAKVAEEAGSDFDTCNEIATAIRALKEQPTESSAA